MNNVSNLDTIYELDSMRHTPLDGQDYETAAGLIKGNQFIAAATFIDGLDTFPRDEMKFVIQTFYLGFWKLMVLINWEIFS